MDLSSKLDLPVPEKHSLEAVHRLKAQKDKIVPIIARFTELKTRDLWLTKKHVLRSENFTKAQKELLWKCRKLAKELWYKFIWTWNNKVLARKSEGMNLIIIVTENDLAKMS